MGAYACWRNMTQLCDLRLGHVATRLPIWLFPIRGAGEHCHPAKGVKGRVSDAEELMDLVHEFDKALPFNFGGQGREVVACGTVVAKSSLVLGHLLSSLLNKAVAEA
jgi:hypothetical protein